MRGESSSGKISRLRLTSALALGLLLLAVGFDDAWAQSPNLLVNGSFETGTFSGWQIGGNTINSGVAGDHVVISGTCHRGDVAACGSDVREFGPNYTNVHTGSFAAFAVVRTVPSEVITLRQTVAVVPGATYDVGFYVNVDTPDTDSANQAYGFNCVSTQNSIVVGETFLELSGCGQLDIVQGGSGTSSADFRHVFGSFTAGPTQTSATVSFTITGSGEGRAGFNFDDFHFSGPRPLTITAIGDRTVNERVNLAFAVNATGGGVEATLTFSAFGLPGGATFTGQQFSWTPTSYQSGTYFPCFQVTDGESFDVDCPTITVNDTVADRDRDGVADADDNCPDVWNPDQANTFGSAGGPGDACDPQFVSTPTTTTNLNSTNNSYTVTQPIVLHACVNFTPTSPPSFVVKPDPYFVLLQVFDSAGHELPIDGIPERRGLILHEDAAKSDVQLITTPTTLCTDVPVSELYVLGVGTKTVKGTYVTKQVKDPRVVNGVCQDGTDCIEPILQTIAPAGTQTFTIRDPDQAKTELGALMVTVNGIADRGLSNSLSAKLRAAQASIVRGNPGAACGQLTAFNNEVAAQAGKKLLSPLPESLTNSANSIKTLLACSA